jgi:hypothetical protein
LSIDGKNKSYRLFDRGVLIPCRDRSGFHIHVFPLGAVIFTEGFRICRLRPQRSFGRCDTRVAQLCR